VASPLRQIFAFSGVLDSGAAGKPSFALVEHAVALAARTRGTRAGPSQVCYVPTAVSIRPGKRAWRVDPAPGGGYTEEPIQPRLI
jgi:hypothetical protein